MSRARDLADSADKDISGTLTVDAITASGTIAANSYTGDGSSLTGINTDLVADTTPELGGGLSTNGNDITFGDNDKAVFGAGSDLQIYHTGTQSIIEDVGTGPLRIRSNSISIENELGTETISALTQDGAVIIYYDGSPKLVTTSTGVDVTGNITVSGTVDGRDVASDGSKLDGIESGATADQSASEILTLIKTVDGAGSGLDADTLDGVSSASFLRSDAADTKTSGDLSFSDNVKANFGAGSDLQIYHTGSHSFIRDNGTGSLYIDATQLNFRNGAQTATYADFTNGGAARLMHNGNVKFETLSNGAQVTGTFYADGVVVGDNEKMQLGNSQDFQMYHTGSASFIDDAGTGGLIIRGNATVALRQFNNDENMVQAIADGAVTLYYDGAEKLATTSGGIDVTGNATFDDNGKAIFGAGSDLQIYHDGSHSYVKDAGTGNLYIEGTNLRLGYANGEYAMIAGENGSVEILHDNATKLNTTSIGISVTGSVSMTDVLLLDQNASNHSSTTEGALYYNTADDAIRVYAGGRWNNLSMLPAVTPAALNFMNHNYTRSSYTGQDGYTRTYGKLTSPTQTYAGNTFATAFDGASNHVLVLRFLASSAAYIGLGVSIASSITDAQADNNPGSSYYGLGGDWTGASGVTHYGGYFNSSSTVPTHTTTDGYVYIYTEGSGASRTLQMKFSAVYSSDFLNTGTELQAGGDTPSGGTRITQSILPITIGTNDLALAIGEASDTYEWRIERYGTY